MPELFPYVCLALAGINLIAWLRNDRNGDAGEDFGELMSIVRFERGSEGYKGTQAFYLSLAVIFTGLGVGSLLGLQL
jgi:hypothetical protein